MVAVTLRFALVAAAAASLAACASVEPRYASRGPGMSAPPTAPGGQKVGKPYQIGGVWYVPRHQPDYDEVGIASWYGAAFNLKPTANGETFDMGLVSAAHTTLPLPSMVEVTNLENGRKMTIRVNDRGPFVGNRIIDLSQEAARQLGYERQGIAKVRVRYLGPAPLLGPEAGVRYAQVRPTPAPKLAARPQPPLQFAEALPAPLPTRGGYPLTLAANTAPKAPAVGVAASPAPASIAAQPLPAMSAQPLPPLGAQTGTSDPGAPSLRIQAGSFTSEANAEQAVARLSATGPAVIETVQRGGLTLYRVTLPSPGDEVAAYALRDRIAGIGFTDARVITSF